MEFGKRKVCNKCNEDKPLHEFTNVYKDNPFYKRAMCKACESLQRLARLHKVKDSKVLKGTCPLCNNEAKCFFKGYTFCRKCVTVAKIALNKELIQRIYCLFEISENFPFLRNHLRPKPQTDQLEFPFDESEADE